MMMMKCFTVCSYNGQEDGRVGLYVAAEPLTRCKNYFEVEIMESGVTGTIGQCPSFVSYCTSIPYMHGLTDSEMYNI